MGKVTLSDAIRAKVPATPVRSVCWFSRLAPEAAAEIAAVKADWKAGRLRGSKRALGQVIVEELHARGLSQIGLQGVVAWLGKE